MSAPELSDVLRHVSARYRAALLANVGLLAGLSAGIIALAAWRLHALAAPLRWVIVGVGVSAAAAAIGLGWRMRRRWISSASTVPHLDRVLGLQARLTTAAEFAHRTPPPALYGLLVDDAARRFSTGQVPFPRLIDRPAIALAVLLLLLLCWPGRGSLPMQLAQLPATVPPLPPPPPPPDQPPPDQQQQHDQQKDQRPHEKQQPSSGQSQPQQGQQPQSQSGSQGQQPSTGQGQQQDQPSQSQSGGQGKPDQHPHAGQQASSGQSHGGQQPPSGQPHAQQQPSSGQPHEKQQPSTGQPQDQRSEQRDTSKSSGDRESQSGSGARPASASADARQSNTAQSTGSGSQQRPGDQSGLSQGEQAPGSGSGQQTDATRAEIQQLLKEVSSELKQMQAKLSEANDQPAPEAGTSTDPELYGAAESLARPSGEVMPIHLETDTAPTSAQRPGGGTGQAGGEAASASPKIAAEDAQLSEQPREETAANRQTIPPEYRSVFEQLQQPRDATQ